MTYCPPERSPRARAETTGFRKVKPKQQKDTPSKQRRRALRAIKQAVETAAQINADASARTNAWSKGRMNDVASKTSELERAYPRLRDDKRAIYSTGLVPEGDAFRGRTMDAGRGA